MKCMIGVLSFAGVAFFFVNHAHAYIDPGTGSMLIQAFLAAVAVCAVSIGIFWSKLKDFWGRLFGLNKDE